MLKGILECLEFDCEVFTLQKCLNDAQRFFGNLTKRINCGATKMIFFIICIKCDCSSGKSL